MALGQSLQQRLQQKLSPQQIQLMKLLQVTTASLEQRIKEELEENPALELGEEGHDEKAEEVRDEFEEVEEFEEGEKEQDDPWDDVDFSEYTDDDGDLPEYKEKDNNYPEMPEGRNIMQSADLSFNDVLLEQLNMQILDEREQQISEHILGSIDDDGYLRRETTSIVDDLAFRQNIITTEKEVEQLIKIIQQFEPAGIAARDLQECLLLQLYRKQNDLDTHYLDVAIEIVEHHFEEFSKKHYEKIQRSMELSDQELKNSIQLILKLSPKPAGSLGDQSNKEGYVIPDFFIYNNNGKLELSLNSLNSPELRVSEDFREMLKDYEKGNKKDKDQKEAVMFIKQKLDAAKWFIDAIKQRQNTLYNTMQAILEHQKAFFLTGDQTELKPMILKDIAEKTGLDISTISRVANSKYVQTEFGTYLLKFFFNESLSTDSGEEVSTREVKKILSDMVESESKKKPLSDERLTDLLNEKGYNIARRTVAKYREQLGIPVARLRKEL